MENPSVSVPLPPSVEQMILDICRKQSQAPPGITGRQELASIGEDASLHILRKISGQKIRATLEKFIIYMARNDSPVSSPQKRQCLTPIKQSPGNTIRKYYQPSGDGTKMKFEGSRAKEQAAFSFPLKNREVDYEININGEEDDSGGQSSNCTHNSSVNWRDRKRKLTMESVMKDVRGGASVLDMDPKSTVGGGVEDIYGEDCATEDQLVTPWTVSVASGCSLLRDPHHNKGLAFSGKERDAHYLCGLLPPAITTQELQEKKMMNSIRQYQVPLQKYMALMDLEERNERLFYKLLVDHVEELLPIVYTPTVGEACQKYGTIFRRPQGLYISLKEKGKILEVLKNWPERIIQVIVVTDGERILGLGDLGCQGMGIPVGKLALYTALGGLRPSACLPITIDVGTNNEELLKDEFYIGLRQRRATGQEYSELLHEFMCAVKQNYGEKVLVQFEDFANHNAFELLAKYGTTHLTFNDDIQGTAAVVLAGLVAGLRLSGGTLPEHKFLFLGAGEAGTGIAELIAFELSKQMKVPLEETRKKIWLVDSKGLIVSSRKESLQNFKKPWAHDHEPVNKLLDAVKAIKPTVLIGSSGMGKAFTKEVIETMASFNEKPLILALSNPTTHSECTAEEAYTWSKGRAIFASGSPFDPVEYNGKVFVPGQSNNAYIFPGFGLGLVISGAIRVHDTMLLTAAEALAGQVTQENFEKGLIYPPFSKIREISAHIAANVAAKAYELGLATRLPRPENLVKYAKSCMYSPVYRNYR